MRRVIGIDIHRTFGEVAFWEDGRLRRAGRIDTRTAPEGYGRDHLGEMVRGTVEETLNAMLDAE
jgi:transposase